MTMRKLVAIVGFIGCLVWAGFVTASAAAHDASDQDRPTMAAQQVRAAMPAFRDEAAMVLVGTALIGLAAAVRRAA